jgi:hypothetical protein
VIREHRPDDADPDPTASDQLEQWRAGDHPKTLGGLIETFEEKSFALLFILLLGLPALPLPTGGATHVFEIIAVLLALQLIAGRDEIWLPRRFKDTNLSDGFVTRLQRTIRRLERFSRPRARRLFDHRLSNIVFGLLVVAGSVAAFVAPPFTGLDTLPALGVVLLSLGFVMEDIALVAVGIAIALVGVGLEIVLGEAAVHGLSSIF